MSINSFTFGLKEMNFVAKTADIIHICTYCGKTATKATIQRDFYKSYSPYHNKENGVTHLCKECFKLFSLKDELNINKLKMSAFIISIYKSLFRWSYWTV